MTKSHSFPKFLIKNWVSENLKENINSIYSINLNLKTYEETVIKSEKDIVDFLKKDKNFYFDIPGKLIRKLESEWNEKYETPFLNHVFNPLLNIYKQYFNNSELKIGKKKSSYEKEINNRFAYSLEKPQIIINFLIINIFRDGIDKGNFKIIDQNNNFRIINPSEYLFFLKNYTEENYIKKINSYFDYFDFVKNYRIFLLPSFNFFMTVPSIYHYSNIFFAIPLSPFGYICFINKDYKIYFNSENKDFKFEKFNSIIDEIFICDKENNDFKELTFYFSYFLLRLWFENHGIKKGKIYLVGNSALIENFMLGIDELGFFDRRKKYTEDDKNYDKSNTFFEVVK